MGCENLTQQTALVGGIQAVDLDDVDGSNPPQPGQSRDALGDDSIYVMSIRECDAQCLGFTPKIAPHGVRIDQSVARRPCRTEEFIEMAVDERHAMPDFFRRPERHSESSIVLDRDAFSCSRVKSRLIIEPKISDFIEGKEFAMGAEEIESRTTGFDIDRLPPGRSSAPCVEFRRCIDPGQVEVDDSDIRHTALRETAGKRRSDDTATSDQYVYAFQDGAPCGKRSPPTDVDSVGFIDEVCSAMSMQLEAREQLHHAGS